MAATNVGLDWLELLPSDDAQQLSAWACVGTRSDPELCESPLCMGHWAPSAQQAMRASGVGIHPAQIAAFPAIRPNVSARAARRWTSLTCLECSTGEAVSNERAGELCKVGSKPWRGIYELEVPLCSGLVNR